MSCPHPVHVATGECDACEPAPYVRALDRERALPDRFVQRQHQASPSGGIRDRADGRIAIGREGDVIARMEAVDSNRVVRGDP
jgi:hypothetical protein